MEPSPDPATIVSKQRWTHTTYEILTNLVVGYILAASATWFYFWWMGMPLDFWTLNGHGILMIGVSTLRQLILRRVFEHIRVVTHN